MLKDTLNSILDNVKERTTNPFLGTLVIVWIVKNWKLVYSLFYFDSAFKLKDRLNYITEYFNKNSFYKNLANVVLTTIVLLILTYLLLGLSRLISDFYERVLIPLISKWTDKSSIVLKSDFQNLQQEMIKLEVRLEEERSAKVQAQNQRDSAYDRIASLSIKDDDSPEQHSYQSDFSNSADTKASKNTKVFDRVANWFKSRKLDSELTGILVDIQKMESIRNSNNVIDKLLIEDLVAFKQHDGSNHTIYTLTSMGKAFLKHWNNVYEEESDS